MSKTYKSRFAAIIITAALLLSAALSVPFLSARADGQAYSASANGVRFRQIEAGEDFVIGLTYDDEVYGWSLKDAPNPSDPKSLGDVYGREPKKIDFTFAAGDTEARVTAIATTRTTAALITTRYIYTWGYDKSNDQNFINANSGTPNWLLLRDVDADKKKVPTAIGYDTAYQSKLFPALLAPADITNIRSIKGSEDNYTVSFVANNKTYYFTWGSAAYNMGFMGTSSYNPAGYEYTMANPTEFDAMDFYMGGNTIVYQDGQNAYLRGKNYYVPTTASGAVTAITYETVTDAGGNATQYYQMTGNQLVSGSDDYYAKMSATGDANAAVDVRYKGAIAGSNANQSGTIADRAATLATTVKSGGAAELSNVGGVAEGVKAAQNTVSVGNGFIYYINSTDSTLKFVGNKENGQDGNSFAGITGTPLSVAAGRTASGTSLLSVPNGGKSVGTLSKANPSDSYYNQLTLAGEFCDGDSYISGAITSTAGKANSVYVWNKDKKTPVELTAGDGPLAKLGLGKSGKNHIVSLSSGYGNNLFALSNLGKAYRVTYNQTSGAFEAEVYDRFDGKDNWAVQSDNSVTLGSSERGDGAKSVILTLDSAADAVANDASGVLDSVATTYNPLVSEDNIKDAYRILRPEADKTVSYIAADALTGGPAVTFKQGTTDITKTSLYQYFDYEFIEQNGKAAIKITPYKKTTTPITMTFYVGRYDSTAQALGSEVFYDYKTVSVEIAILNTDARFDKFLPYANADGSGNASVPLLDPNHPDYKYYSLALSNVSEGFKTLAAGLSNLSATGVEDALKTAAAGRDPGFPAVSKQETDNYYGLNAYYDGSYRYFGYDRDGDLISIYSQDGITNLGRDYFDLSEIDIKVELDMSGYLGSGGADEAKIAEYVNLVYNDLYGLRPKYDSDTHKLSLNYRVLQIAAKKSTNTVVYNGGRVSDFSTQASSDAKTFTLMLVEKSEDDRTETDNIGRLDGVPVHAQASLTTSLKKEGDLVTGKEGNNAYTLQPAATALPTVGGEQPSITFKISDFFPKGGDNFVDTTSIRFVHEKISGETVSYNDYEGFNKQFDENEAVVALSGTELTVTPKTTNLFDCTVAVRRFLPGSQTEVFQGEEVFYLNIKFKAKGGVFGLKEGFELGSGGTLRGPQTVSVTDVATGSQNLLEFSAVAVTDSTVLKATRSADNKTIEFKPLKSGVVMVTYTVSHLGESRSNRLTIAVESMTTLETIYDLASDQSFPLSMLKSGLKKENQTSKNVIDALVVPRYDAEGGLSTAGNAAIAEGRDKSYYFLVEENGEWVPCEKPDFIYKIVYKGDAGSEFFSVQVGSFTSTNNRIYKIAFRLMDPTDSNTVFEISVRVKPAKMYVKNDDGQDLVINVDTKNLPAAAQNGDAWYGNSKGEVVIPVQFLMKGFGDLVNNVTDYNISVVVPSDGSEDFFDYSFDAKNITIIPKYPTKSVQTIEVSVTDNDVPYILSFSISIEGIVTTLTKHDYLMILMITAICVFALLLIIFIIRMGVYWKKKAEQKRIIRKNQMLIKMRDKMHNKTESATREQLVKTKLKMEDPKYAKMFNELRKDKEAETGISLDNSMVAQKAETKNGDKGSKKKKKGGKKSIEDLKAELEAKKAAFAQMQSEGMSQPIVDAPMFDADTYSGGLSREDVENQIKAKIGSDEDILFDVEPMPGPDDNNNF